jgi:hypothetical protein
MNLRHVLLGVLLLSWSASASAQAVKLEFRAGQVHLSARNAPLRAILAEWSRLGGTKFVNGERVPGAPVTIELTGVSERQAIDILLRGAAGYIVGPRLAGSTAASGFGNILILPTSTPVGRQASAVAPVPAAGRRAQPAREPEPEPEPDDEALNTVPEPEERRTPAAIRQAAEAANRQRVTERRAQIFVGDQAVEAQQQGETQRAPAQPASSPFGAVPGAVRPGVITPVPEQQDNRRRQAETNTEK